MLFEKRPGLVSTQKRPRYTGNVDTNGPIWRFPAPPKERVYFACSPDRRYLVAFRDLPGATREALRQPTVEELNAIRKKAGLGIDPKTAEIYWKRGREGTHMAISRNSRENTLASAVYILPVLQRRRYLGRVRRPARGNARCEGIDD